MMMHGCGVRHCAEQPLRREFRSEVGTLYFYMNYLDLAAEKCAGSFPGQISKLRI